MANKTITLLPSDQIMERLKQVDDTDYMVERFYPHLAAEGGRELVPMGIVMALNLAIYDFTSQGYPPIINALLSMNVPRYIECLTDDQEAIDEAKKVWQEIIEKMKGGEV